MLDMENVRQLYFDKDEREIYEAERKHRMDVKEEIRTAMEKGIAQGLEQGVINSATALLDILDNETISEKLSAKSKFKI